MLEEVARAAVDGLRARGVDAHLVESGVYTFGVRVVLPGGREAIWGEGGGDLSAEVLEDGDLVGMVPEIDGSAEFTADEVVHVIARADYSEPVGHERTEDPPAEAPLAVEGGLFRRFRDGFRYR
ncbi:MAG TPA: hypothetical protein VKQ07_08155 [Jatrophihabitantaceae bacterium]|jgi:hypothetical protein|nr:hypothetical protein [Jatrophihabitantaceae bacterium]